ncbi:MAG: S41 family peptidase [Phycisphaerales bacterium]
MVPLARLTLAIILAFALPIAAIAQTTPPNASPANAAAATPPLLIDFATTDLGQMPDGWFIPTPGYTAKVIADADAKGGRVVELARNPGPVRGFGNFIHTIDATPYRGKRINLKGWARPGPGDEPVRAQMWLRVDREDNKPGFFDNMSDRPITRAHADQYRVFSIIGNIAADAKTLNFGFILMGMTGSVRIASMSIEVMGDAIDADKPAAPLSGRGLHNVTAFAELYGIVRFFHPTDQAKGVDWDRLAIAGVERVEPCKDAAELAAALTHVFKPIAPTLQVWPGDEHTAPPTPPPAMPAEATQITAWSHFGVQLPQPTPGNPYRSTRGTESISTPAAARKLPAPDAAVTHELAGGVIARIPIAIPTDPEGHTLPLEAPGKLPVVDRPEGWQPSGNDRSTRLAAIIIAWTTLEHFYPYFDVVEADWHDALPQALARAAADRDAPAFLTTIRTLIARLHDGHGYVASPGMAGPSPLPLDWAWVGESLVITVPDPAGKLQRGDIVDAIDDKPVDQLYAQLVPTISGATDQWVRWRAIAELRQLPQFGEQTSLSVRRADGAKATVQITHRPTDPQPKPEPRPENGSELAPGIVYFNLDGGTAEQLNESMDKLKAAKGIVFDLRGYPADAGALVLQHLTSKPIQSAKWIIPVTTMPDGDKRTWFNSGRWNLTPRLPRLGGPDQPVAFVTDGRAISYAESCMGIVEAYKLAEIVGGPTAGTNGNINPFVLPGGYRVVWTGMKVIKHDDSRHHGVGIAPTVSARRTQEGIAAGKDELLDASVEVVKKKLPSAPAQP